MWCEGVVTKLFRGDMSNYTHGPSFLIGPNFAALVDASGSYQMVPRRMFVRSLPNSIRISYPTLCCYDINVADQSLVDDSVVNPP